MEPASKVIRQMGLPGDTLTVEELVCASWPRAVGKRIAAHTRAARMVRQRLVVEVEDRTWQRPLFTLTGQILRTLEKSVGAGVVEDIEFRIVPRKREPLRETRLAPAADESDAIGDPVLRDLYRASRKKALA